MIHKQCETTTPNECIGLVFAVACQLLWLDQKPYHLSWSSSGHLLSCPLTAGHLGRVALDHLGPSGTVRVLAFIIAHIYLNWLVIFLAV